MSQSSSHRYFRRSYKATTESPRREEEEQTWNNNRQWWKRGSSATWTCSTTITGSRMGGAKIRVSMFMCLLRVSYTDPSRLASQVQKQSSWGWWGKGRVDGSDAYGGGPKPYILLLQNAATENLVQGIWFSFLPQAMVLFILPNKYVVE